jgi:TatD DNase family protein
VDEVGVPARGAVLHAFAGDAAALRWARRHGLILGIGGPVTYKNSHLPALLARTDPDGLLDGILLETDAPWLPPVPHRGERNEPGFLPHTRDRLAAILSVGTQEVERCTDAAFHRLFGGSWSAGDG